MQSVVSTILMCALSLAAMTAAVAQERSFGRYISGDSFANEALYFPLLEVKTFRFHAFDATVLQAIEQILVGSGYALAPSSVLDSRSFPMLTSTVASNQRHIENISRLGALKALAGPGFEVVVDPLSRRVAFDVCLHTPDQGLER